MSRVNSCSILQLSSADSKLERAGVWLLPGCECTASPDRGGGVRHSLAAMAEQAYIGCTISLISKNQMRYEATLVSIDTTKAELALSNGTWPFNASLVESKLGRAA